VETCDVFGSYSTFRRKAFAIDDEYDPNTFEPSMPMVIPAELLPEEPEEVIPSQYGTHSSANNAPKCGATPRVAR